MINRAVRAALLGLSLLAPTYGVASSRLSPPEKVTPVAGATRGEEAAEVPFGAGEKLAFEVRFGSIKVGSGSLEVIGVESVRGRDAWHTSFNIQGGTFFYRVNDRYESWIDTHSLNSLLFIRQIEEGTRERTQNYDILPERGIYVERTAQETNTFRTVSQPLDEGAFLYFVRTVPLKVGETYDFNRYFIPDRNPVRVTVLRRERVTVPAGTFNAIVVKPVIKTKGIFSEKGQAEVWLSDDSTRMLLQVKSKLSFGSLNLYLKSYTPAASQAKIRH